MLTPHRKTVLAELAEFISDDFCPKGMITPCDIVEASGIGFSCGDYGNAFDGLLEHQYGKFHIYINANRLQHAYTPRARFTIAHELGHYFIDEHRNALKSGKAPSHPSFTNFQSSNIVEREADYFAASLLLPATRVKADVNRRKFNFNLLDELSKKYQTSLMSTAIRFADIGNHPIMVIFSKNGIIEWKWSSKDFPYYHLKNGNRVPETTVAGDFFATKSAFTGTDQIIADDWFQVWDNRYLQKFYEHCIPYAPLNCALSIVWED